MEVLPPSKWDRSSSLHSHQRRHLVLKRRLELVVPDTPHLGCIHPELKTGRDSDLEAKPDSGKSSGKKERGGGGVGDLGGEGDLEKRVMLS